MINLTIIGACLYLIIMVNMIENIGRYVDFVEEEEDLVSYFPRCETFLTINEEKNLYFLTLIGPDC